MRLIGAAVGGFIWGLAHAAAWGQPSTSWQWVVLALGGGLAGIVGAQLVRTAAA